MGGLNKREHLIKNGQEQILAKGYDLSSIKDITDAAGLPKGSFYHYFDSKEKFALEAMNDYIKSFAEGLPDNQLNIGTLEKLIDARIAAVSQISFARECYISIMSHASSNKDETFRKSVVSSLEDSNDVMKTLLKALVENKQTNSQLELDELVEFVDFSWRGARLKAKLLKSDKPLKIFKKYLLAHILKV